MAKTPAWQRAAGKDPAGGLNSVGRASAKAEGHNLKPPAPHPKTEKDAKRRKSFCARMSGMPGAMKEENGKPTRKALSLRAWNCADGGAIEEEIIEIKKPKKESACAEGMEAHSRLDRAPRSKKSGGEVWDKPRPKDLGKPHHLSDSQKSSAKAAAKAAGRPWPNLVDSMNAAKKKQ
jgi:hypothetical protein